MIIFQREREHRTKPKIRRVFAVCGWNKAKKAVSVTDSNSDEIIEWRFTKYVWAVITAVNCDTTRVLQTRVSLEVRSRDATNSWWLQTAEHFPF